MIEIPKKEIKNRQIEIILQGFGLEAVKAVGFFAGEKLLARPLPNKDSGKFQIGTADSTDTTMPAWDRGSASASFLDNPTFDQFSIQQFQWTDLRGSIHAIPTLYIDLVLFEISMPKNIVMTELQGFNGTVKEYISQGDFVVNIKGAFVDKNPMRYPKEQVQKFIEVCMANVAVPVLSDFLQLFQIYNLVFKTPKFIQKEGFRNTQLFEVEAYSDNPIILTIQNEGA